jgi:tetratricopeptide (TPR) repeat protein
VEHRRLLATSYGAQGLSLGGMNQAEEALAAHRKALAVREAIAREWPDDPLATIDVARTHRNMGGIYRAVGKPAQALAEWDEALRIGRPLLDSKHGQVRETDDLTGRKDPLAILREDLASVLLDQAITLHETGRGSDARVAWAQALDLFEGLVRDHPKDLALRNRLADACSDGATIERGRSNPEEALRLIRRAVETREVLASENPAIPLYRRALAENLLMLGWTCKSLNRVQEALSAYRRASEVAEALLILEPGHVYTTNLLAQGLTARAIVLSGERKPEEALSLARRAVTLMEPVVRDNPDHIFHISAFGQTLRVLGWVEAAAGNSPGALQAFERAAATSRQLADRYPVEQYNAACALALAAPLAPPARREALASDSVQSLRKALAAGYAQVENLATDSDLDALRDRADFKALLAETVQKKP